MHENWIPWRCNFMLVAMRKWTSVEVHIKSLIWNEQNIWQFRVSSANMSFKLSVNNKLSNVSYEMLMFGNRKTVFARLQFFRSHITMLVINSNFGEYNNNFFFKKCWFSPEQKKHDLGHLHTKNLFGCHVR